MKTFEIYYLFTNKFTQETIPPCGDERLMQTATGVVYNKLIRVLFHSFLPFLIYCVTKLLPSFLENQTSARSVQCDG